MKSLKWELKQEVDAVTTLEVDMNVFHEMLIEDLQMEQEFKLTKVAPWGLQEELLHLEKWTAHVKKIAGSCSGSC